MSDEPGTLSEPVGSLTLTMVRTRTLALFRRLGAERKVDVLQVLYESGVIVRNSEETSAVVTLSGADLSGTNMSGDSWSGVDLSGTDLRGANLRDAELTEANFDSANLEGANFSGATGITKEQLIEQAWSLEGAILPEGQEYQDWLTGKESRGKATDNYDTQ